MTQLRLSPPPSVEEQSRGFMTEHSKREDQVRRPEPLTDFCREDRHELVQKLAYQHWEERGRPPVRQKSTGLQPKRRYAPTFWLQESNSGLMKGCTDPTALLSLIAE